ncbi:unnamed protein product [Ostreobium quekettii]|uniref:Uncharacterized protein n=1 Tax=Ostreobium quekettii TaxID=121088 RepID=A0A8S1J0K2_9CHLO|nr:unnamed protein product [Ostreobium quekettii]
MNDRTWPGLQCGAVYCVYCVLWCVVCLSCAPGCCHVLVSIALTSADIPCNAQNLFLAHMATKGRKLLWEVLQSETASRNSVAGRGQRCPNSSTVAALARLSDASPHTFHSLDNDACKDGFP